MLPYTINYAPIFFFFFFEGHTGFGLCVRASVRHAFWCMPYLMNRVC